MAKMITKILDKKDVDSMLLSLKGVSTFTIIEDEDFIEVLHKKAGLVFCTIEESKGGFWITRLKENLFC